MKNSEKKDTIERYEKLIANHRLRKKIGILISVIIILTIIEVFLIKQYYNMPHICGNTLIRYYNEVMRILHDHEEPEYELGVRYKSNIPIQMQKDIEKLNRGQIDRIIYYTDINENSGIKIVEDDSGEIFVQSLKTDYFSASNDISFYKNGRNIVVCGRPSDRRELRRMENDSYTGDITGGWLRKNIDLLGTQYYDDTDVWNRDFSNNFTVVMDGRNFKFYRLGINFYTTTFPGKEILVCLYDYILDEDNDLYYICSTGEEPLKFIEVDQHIDELDSQNIYSDSPERSSYHIYVKNDERYAAVLDEAFKVHKIKLVPENVEYVKFERRGDTLFEFDWYFDWYIKKYYRINGEYFYEKERIKGLDTYLSLKIPEEEYQKFVNLRVSVDQVDGVIKELKDLYEKYE